MSMVEEFLEHFGVKGMRWGVRRDAKVYKQSSDSKKVSELRKRPAHSLSNNQLKTLNERLNLEQNHNRLNPTKVQRGHTRAKTILGVVGTGVTAYNLLRSPAGQSLMHIGKKHVTKVG